MGEVLLLPTARGTATTDTIARLQAGGLEVWAMTPLRTADNLWELPVPRRVAVVLGAEGPGLDGPTMASADRCVRIPITGGVDSLNVGHAAAITFAALARHA
jgi:tRNA G18 (ribose-2'-O)-methylase SpoU